MIKLKKGALDYETNKPIDINKKWEVKESYTHFSIISNGYETHIIESKYIIKA